MKTVGKEIIDGLNRGSEPAFAALYDAYFSYLCACAATYVLDPVCAEELVNDVFVNIWEHRGRYRTPLHGYLVNSVRNACISHIRSQLFRRRLREGYERELLLFAEQQCLTDAHPLEVLSAQEVETPYPGRCRDPSRTLPGRLRAIFLPGRICSGNCRESANQPRHGTRSHQKCPRPAPCRTGTVADGLSFHYLLQILITVPERKNGGFC